MYERYAIVISLRLLHCEFGEEAKVGIRCYSYTLIGIVNWSELAGFAIFHAS